MSSSERTQSHLAALIANTGLSVSAELLASATGSGSDDPFVFEPERAIGLLARSLAQVHTTALGVESDQVVSESEVVSPFELVERARATLDLPLIEQQKLSPAYSHMSRGRLVEILADGAESVAERSTGVVLNQGSPTLGNLRFVGVELLGFADWSGACIADPYLDLAIACRDILELFGAPPIRVLLEGYSSEPLDPVRLDWFTLATELAL